MITKPLLPPKAGYVEVIDEHGNHIYRATTETEAKLAKESDAKYVQNDLDAINVDHEYRLTLLELGLTE